ncbi:MAG: SIR2 family protein, partial [Actinomycetota bacterium]|nr:SIR2 family protein [Actinomycetota bacterium]
NASGSGSGPSATTASESCSTQADPTGPSSTRSPPPKSDEPVIVVRMNEDAPPVLFLGAGASLPLPAGGPLFGQIRDACAKRAGVETISWERGDPRRILLDHIIPEVFLKALADAGYELGPALTRAVGAGRLGAPNAVHHLAASVLERGGLVCTTNWDTWIEQAHRVRAGRPPAVAVHPVDEAPSELSGRLVKLHGCVSRPGSLLFSTPQIMRPLDARWLRALVDACRGGRLFVAGYAGADVDLYPALASAIEASKATYWFEGVGDDDLDGSTIADYERWRFALAGVVHDPTSLPASGAHLVWCGRGSTSASPADGLLDAFGVDGDVHAIPDAEAQYEAVEEAISHAPQVEPRRARRLLLRAVVDERLGARWSAAAKHAAVVMLGNRREKGVAVRSLGNLVMLRSHRLRLALVLLYTKLSRSEERVEFLVLQAGGVAHDTARVRRVLDGSEQVSIDTGLNLAGTGRWSGDLRLSERLARSQLERALAEDLASLERNWPERVSRAAFELAQSLIWQGRYREADDVCRTALMRVSGSKWTAWEFAIRAVPQFARREHHAAIASLSTAIDLLHGDGFHDFTRTLFTARAACHRVIGRRSRAAADLAEAEGWPRKGPGTVAAILAERAEQAIGAGARTQAIDDWLALTTSSLPLWRALGHLRLAENEIDADRNLRAALADFTDIGCRWGEIRATALAEGRDAAWIEARADGLGPAESFTPGGPWLF